MESKMSLSTEIPAADDADLVWGADAIGNVIGRTARQVDHLLHKGLLPARKFGGRWVASRKRLLGAVVGDDR